MMRCMNRRVSAGEWTTLAGMTYLIVVLLILVHVVSVSAHDLAGGKEKMTVHYFGSQTYGQCLAIRKELLESLSEKHPDTLDVIVYDINQEQDFALLMKMEETYGVKVSSAIELFLPDTFLTGFDDIMRHGKQYTTVRLDDPSTWQSKNVDVDSSQFSSSLQQKSVSFFCQRENRLSRILYLFTNGESNERL